MRKLIFGFLCSVVFLIPLGVSAAEKPLDISYFPPDIQALIKKDPKTITEQEAEKVYAYVSSYSQTAVAPTRMPGTVDCFDHYRFGSVQVDLSSTAQKAVPGDTVTFKGKIKNTNPYPIVDGSVYVKIFKRVKQDSSLTMNNGYPLVSQFLLPEAYTLAASSEQDTSIVWTVPDNAASGEYFAAFFFQSARRYDLLGLSFTDDVTGNLDTFTITNPIDTQLVTLDKNTVTLNGQRHAFAQFPLEFNKDEPVVAKVSIKNPRNEPATVSLDWKLYDWSSLGAMFDTRSESLTLKAGEVRTVEYSARPTGTAVSYLVVEVRDGQSTSLLDIRFVRTGTEENYVYFPSTETYPLKAGEQASVFACFSNTTEPLLKDNTITLTLRDMSGKTIHTYQYKGDTKDIMSGVTDTFVPNQSYANFTLTATLERGGVVVQKVTQTYDCQKINSSLCPQTTAFVGMDMEGAFRKAGILGASFLSLLGIILIGRRYIRNRRNILHGFLLCILLGMGVSGTQAHAESVTWNDVIVDTEPVPVPCDPGPYCPAVTGYSTAVGVTFTAGASYPNGSSIPVGTVLNFSAGESSEADATVVWFHPAGHNASPYGTWYDTLSDASWAHFYGGAFLAMKRPTKTMTTSGTAGLSCSGLSCTVTSPGTIRVTLAFSDAKGYVGYASTVNVPVQSITFNFNAYTPCVAYAGAACRAWNSCGNSNVGTYNCAGVCSAVAPPNPAGYGSTCTSVANACGATASGAINCSGVCSAVAPPNPAGLGLSCTSAPNACGMTSSSGVLTCAGCNSPVPSNALCTLRICNDCSSASEFSNVTIASGTSRGVKACYNDGSASTCAGGYDVTASTVWTKSGEVPSGIITLSSVGTITAASGKTGNATVRASYAGSSDSVPVGVTCSAITCSAPSVKATTDAFCPGTSRDFPDGCSGIITCPGTRYCDANLREVKP